MADFFLLYFLGAFFDSGRDLLWTLFMVSGLMKTRN
jgi:hypothetical protein